MATITEPGAEHPHVVITAEPGELLGSVDEATVTGLYKKYGALLFRGFKLSLNEFRSITDTYCIGAAFNDSPGREMLDENTNIQGVDPGTAAFPLHPELSREPWRPDVCFFGCMGQPTRGGETTLCDGIEIVKNMEPDLFDAFDSHRLRYTQAAAADFCEFWLGSGTPDDATLQNPPESCPYTFTRFEGTIFRTFTAPALHTPMFSPELAFGNFLFFSRYMLRKDIFPVFDNLEKVSDELLDAVKAISDRITVPIEWHPGDVVMLDNTRFMHGRNAILDLSERRIMTYFGYLRFAEPGAEEPADAPWRQPGFRPPPVLFEQA